VVEAPNTRNLDKAVAGAGVTDRTIREPATIDQFWDKNQFVMPWMEKFLPESRMWQDSMVTVIGMFLIGYVGWVVLHLFFHFDKLYAAISLISASYLLARLNIRMTRAQRKLYMAKRDERKNG